jgi:hypothetical protein
MTSTYPRPDANSIKLRFPEFATTDDPVVEFAIEEALSQVDDTWIEGDRVLAVSLYVAHLLAIASASAGVDGRDVVSESIGPISVTYASVVGATASGSDLGGTSYGKRYKSLARRNFPGPVVI